MSVVSMLGVPHPVVLVLSTYGLVCSVKEIKLHLPDKLLDILGSRAITIFIYSKVNKK
jgi:hypothetical protein